MGKPGFRAPANRVRNKEAKASRSSKRAAAPARDQLSFLAQADSSDDERAPVDGAGSQSDPDDADDGLGGLMPESESPDEDADNTAIESTARAAAHDARQAKRNTYLSNHAKFTDHLARFALSPSDTQLTVTRFHMLCDVAPPDSFERSKVPRLHTKSTKSASWKRWARFDGDVYSLRGIYSPSVLTCMFRINGIIRLALHGDHTRVVPVGLGSSAVRAIAAYENLIPPTQHLHQNHLIIHLVLPPITSTHTHTHTHSHTTHVGTHTRARTHALHVCNIKCT